MASIVYPLSRSKLSSTVSINQPHVFSQTLNMYMTEVTQNTRTPLNGLGSHFEKLTYIHWPNLD